MKMCMIYVFNSKISHHADTNKGELTIYKLLFISQSYCMNYDKSEQTSEPKSEIEKDYATLFPISSPWLPRMNIKMSQPLQHAEAFILFCL